MGEEVEIKPSYEDGARVEFLSGEGRWKPGIVVYAPYNGDVRMDVGGGVYVSRRRSVVRDRREYRSTLFLDVDGVLNNHVYDPRAASCVIDRDKVELVNSVLEAADACYVLSSAWRYLVHRREMSLVGLEWLLRSHGLLPRLVGVTRKDTAATTCGIGHIPASEERGQQIADYGARAPYAVVDDYDLGISKRHPFVKTDPKVGITAADAAKLVRLLS